MTEVDFWVEELPGHQALGLVRKPQRNYWRLKFAMLSYPSSKRLIITRYERLRFFGGSLPLLLPLKLQLQRISKLSLGWNAQIPEQQREAWERFIKRFPKLNQICVPRTFQGLTNSFENQLQVFVDASNNGIALFAIYVLALVILICAAKISFRIFKAFFNSLYGVKRCCGGCAFG